MIVMNSSLCSNEFNAAFAALEKGSEIRRKCWPDGQYLKIQPSGFVGVVRQGRDFAPPWIGPSNDESDATDWECWMFADELLADVKPDGINPTHWMPIPEAP